MSPEALPLRWAALALALWGLPAAALAQQAPEAEAGEEIEEEVVVYRRATPPGSSLVSGPGWREPLPSTLSREFNIWTGSGASPEDGLASLLPGGSVRSRYVPGYDLGVTSEFSDLGLGGERVRLSLNGMQMPLSALPTRATGGLTHGLGSLPGSGTDGVRMWKGGLGASLGPRALAGALDVLTAPQSRGFDFSFDRLVGTSGSSYGGSFLTGTLSLGTEKHAWLVQVARRSGDAWVAAEEDWASAYLAQPENHAFAYTQEGRLGGLVLPSSVIGENQSYGHFTTDTADLMFTDSDGETESIREVLCMGAAAAGQRCLNVWPDPPDDVAADPTTVQREMNLSLSSQGDGRWLDPARPRLYRDINPFFDSTCSTGETSLVTDLGACRQPVGHLVQTGATPSGNRLLVEVNHQYSSTTRMRFTGLSLSEDSNLVVPGQAPGDLTLWRDGVSLEEQSHPVLDRFAPLLQRGRRLPSVGDFLQDFDEDEDGVQNAEGNPYTDEQRMAAVEAHRQVVDAFSLRSLVQHRARAMGRLGAADAADMAAEAAAMTAAGEEEQRIRTREGLAADAELSDEQQAEVDAAGEMAGDAAREMALMAAADAEWTRIQPEIAAMAAAEMEEQRIRMRDNVPMGASLTPEQQAEVDAAVSAAGNEAQAALDALGRDTWNFRAQPQLLSRRTVAERRQGYGWELESLLGKRMRMRARVQIGSSETRVTRADTSRARLELALQGYGGSLCDVATAQQYDMARDTYLLDEDAEEAEIAAAFTQAEQLLRESGDFVVLLGYYDAMVTNPLANNPPSETELPPLEREDLAMVALLHAIDPENMQLFTYQEQQAAFRRWYDELAQWEIDVVDDTDLPQPERPDYAPRVGIVDRDDLLQQVNGGGAGQSAEDGYLGRGRVADGGACLFWDPLELGNVPELPAPGQGTYTHIAAAEVFNPGLGQDVLNHMEIVSVLDYSFDSLDAEFAVEGGNGVVHGADGGSLGWSLGARFGTEDFARVPNGVADLGAYDCAEEAAAGVACYGDLYSTPAVMPVDETRTGYDFFGEMRLGGTGSWEVQAGARLSGRGSETAPSLLVGGRYDLLPGLRLRAAWSSSAGFPDLPQLRGGEAQRRWVHALGRELPVQTLGSDSLGAETLDKLSFGVDWRPWAGFSLTADFFNLGLNDSLVLDSAPALVRRYTETLAPLPGPEPSPDACTDDTGGGTDGTASNGVCDDMQDIYDTLVRQLAFSRLGADGQAHHRRDLALAQVRHLNGPDLTLTGLDLSLRWHLASAGLFSAWLSLDHRELLAADAGTLWLDNVALVPGGDVLGHLNAESPFGAQPRQRSRLAFDLDFASIHKVRLAARSISSLYDNRNDSTLAQDMRWDLTYTARFPNRRAVFALSIENLTDQAPPTAPTPWGFEPSVHSGSGPLLRLGLRHSFGPE